MPVDGELFRRVMRQWASGVTVVTVRHDAQVRAILVTSFLSVAIDPATVLVSIRRDGETHRLLEAGRVFAVNLLREDQAPLARSLGYADDPEARSLRAIRTMSASPAHRCWTIASPTWIAGSWTPSRPATTPCSSARWKRRPTTAGRRYCIGNAISDDCCSKGRRVAREARQRKGGEPWT